jgi:hypothetical protein
VTGAAGGVEIRPMRAGDEAAVLAIYQVGIDGGDATFEVDAGDWAAFDRGRLPDHRLVAISTASDSRGRAAVVLGTEVGDWRSLAATAELLGRCPYVGRPARCSSAVPRSRCSAVAVVGRNVRRRPPADEVLPVGGRRCEELD